ncbi:MAG TPA: RagB/SusD family nutrient uptake outer membrane protein [Puia sp.]|nr:RagB/SusD family nutrient uptake outer membrane protein [Puia sp.]
MTLHRLIPMLLLAVILLVAGCNKWLDVRPKSQVKEEQLLSTGQGFKDALYGGYSLMGRPALYGGEMTMGFAAARSQDYDLSNTINFYYGDGDYNYTNTLTLARVNNIWDSAYNVLANINNVLDQIDGHKGAFTGDDYALVKGEALGLRAYIHFDLLRLFAPSYLTGSNKAGIPYVTTLTKKVTPSSTVAEVTDLALKDLSDAETLLAQDPITEGTNGGAYSSDNFLQRRSCHFNLYAAKALKARIYLYKGD